mmetsp:Transcript_10189/g.27780  ORF Transcript_10189/g.27780 Transcript_10189/m.27780 type:complete len:290 (-) Transcript_10189:786-1655(-)
MDTITRTIPKESLMLVGGRAVFRDVSSNAAPSSFPICVASKDSMSILKPSSPAAEKVAALATRPASQVSSASGNSSAKTIQIMHPAANPSDTGSRNSNVLTKRNDGIAINGCGRHVVTLQKSASTGVAPCDTSTVAFAMPSGMLWMPIATVVSSPWSNPFSPTKLTPTPQPSPTACAAMIPTTSIIRFAFAPCSFPKDTSPKLSRYLCINLMNIAPTHIPRITIMAPYGCPSWIRSNEAANITPQATAVASPFMVGDSSLTKKKGMAPNPADSAIPIVRNVTSMKFDWR